MPSKYETQLGDIVSKVHKDTGAPKKLIRLVFRTYLWMLRVQLKSFNIIPNYYFKFEYDAESGLELTPAEVRRLNKIEVSRKRRLANQEYYYRLKTRKQMKGSDFNDGTGGESKRIEGVSICPAGNQLMRCYGVAHLGHKLESNPKFSDRNMIVLFFESMDNSAVFFEGKEAQPYGLKLEFNYIGGDRSNFCKLLTSWLGIPFSWDFWNTFDSKTLIGKYAMCTVVHDKGKTSGKAYAKIDTVTSVPARIAQNLPEPVNENYYFSVWEHGFFTEPWLRLPNWMRKQILQQDVYSEFRQLQDMGYQPWQHDHKPAVDLSRIPVKNGYFVFQDYKVYKDSMGRGPRVPENQYPEPPQHAQMPTQEDFDSGLGEEDDLPF